MIVSQSHNSQARPTSLLNGNMSWAGWSPVHSNMCYLLPKCIRLQCETIGKSGSKYFLLYLYYILGILPTCIVLVSAIMQSFVT